MNTASDRFQAFVATVAGALDEPSIRGEEVAARMYLSRYHCDRVVAAAAGETPARFRRRILLERAAFRLLTSRTGVLDIAIEAGYSSHEAFTRAFRRAYGQSPAQWRRNPTQLRLESPNGVHFHPPAGLRMPATRQERSMDLLRKMIDHHVWLVGELVDRAGRLDDEVLDAPVEPRIERAEDGMASTAVPVATLRSVLSRLIGQLAMWNAAMSDRDYDFDVEIDESVESMRSRLAEAGPEYRRQIQAVADRDGWEETFVDALCDPPRLFTYGGMVAHVLTFAAYHRTLAVQALDAAGIGDLGWGDPMRWVSDQAS